MSTTPTHQITHLQHGKIIPSTLNPRIHFDPQKLEELKSSMAEHGFTPAISHLLVRPLEFKWEPKGITTGFALQYRTHESSPWKNVRDLVVLWPTLAQESWALLLTDDDCKQAMEWLPAYELVCGERRWRGAGDLIAAGKIAEMVPAVIEAMSDTRVLELQLIENLQRDDLTALEEAEGFRSMLDLRDDRGEPLHTPKSLATKIGRTEMHVRDRLAICKLRGTPAGEALESGDITLTHARLLARIPAGTLRDTLTKRVVKTLDGSPMPSRQLECVIRSECMVELRGAEFDQNDAQLLPVQNDEQTGERMMGGVCGDCPFNTRNNSDEQGSRQHMCMNPECFRVKVQRTHEGWMASVSDPAKNRRALTVDEAERIFDHTGKKLEWNSGYVEIDAKPDDSEIKRGAVNNLPWKKLIKGTGVEIVLAKDAGGKVHELAKRDEAIAAAVVAGHNYFRNQVKDARASTDDLSHQGAEAQAEMKKRQQEMEAQAVKAARISEAEMEAVLRGASRAKLPDEFWALAIETLCFGMTLVGEGGNVLKRHGLDTKIAAEDVHAGLLKYAQKIESPAERNALVVELLLHLRVGIGDEKPIIPRWAKAFGVDLKAARKDAAAALDAEEKSARERAEIASGIEWSNLDVETEWNEHGVALTPERGVITFAKGHKLKAAVSLARDAKGWRFGMEVDGANWGHGSPCTLTDVCYSTRAAALRTALLAIQQELTLHQSPDAAIARVVALIEAIGTPPEKSAPKKRAPKTAAKKKG